MVSRRVILRAVIALLSILSAQCSPEPAGPTEALGDGEQVYLVHCASCHGPRGEGGRGPTLAVPVLARAPSEEQLIAIIREGVPGTEMPRSQLNKGQLSRVAAFVRSLTVAPAALPAGDPQRGRVLYSKADCSRCHAIAGRGGASGPDLTQIGLSRSAAYLRTALTTPEADVPQATTPFRSDVRMPRNFLHVRAVTRDGTRVEGTRVNEDTFTIQIRDASDRMHSLRKSELSELHEDWGRSPMPSYRDAFSDRDLDDLTAYLASLRGDA